MKKAIANIPILIVIVLVLGITPFAIKLVQQNQNLQNRASDSPIQSIPCLELSLVQQKYCQQIYPSPPATNSGVPCTDLSAILTQYCP